MRLLKAVRISMLRHAVELQQCVLYFILSSVVTFSGWAASQERDIYAPMHQVLHLNICLLVG